MNSTYSFRSLANSQTTILSGYTDIQGMLGAELRNLQTAIAHIHDVLLDSLHLITEDDGVAFGK